MAGEAQVRLRALPPLVLDAALGAAVAAAMVLTISIADEEEATRSPDLVAYLIGVAVGGLLLARRRFPLGVLVGSIGALMAYYSLDYPAFPPAVPLAAAAYSAVVAGHAVATSLLLAGLVLFGVGWQTLGEETDLATILRNGTLTDAALLAAVVLLGAAVRNRRAWAEEVRLRLQRADEERERDAARRVDRERLRIARELHDVLAHTIAAINVQAGAAVDALRDEPDAAETSLRAIRDQSRRAIAELRTTIGVLREGEGPASRAPAPGLAELDRLVDVVERAGVAVDVSVAGRPHPLPPAVELTAYRVVQESLTNVVRHAGASVATVALGYDGTALVVTVEDDGRGADGPVNGAGHGLIGMRERAASVGGTLEAGPGARGGFRVVARLPATGPGT